MAVRFDPLAEFRSTCRSRSCRAPILWADTTTGERMPLDPRPTSTGNVLIRLTDEDQPRLIAAVLTRGQIDGARADGKRLYRSHFASCPDADGHRRNRSKTRRWRRRP